MDRVDTDFTGGNRVNGGEHSAASRIKRDRIMRDTGFLTEGNRVNEGGADGNILTAESAKQKAATKILNH